MSRNEFIKAYKNVENLLFKFALRLTRSKFAADDLLQETACKAYANRNSFSGKSLFKSWISTIMYNTHMTKYRSEQRRKKLQQHIHRKASLTNPKSKTTNRGYLRLLKEDVQTVIDQVGPKSRKALVMYTKGYPYKEISQKLNVPIGTIKSRINYARNQAKDNIMKMGLKQHYA